MRRLITLLFLLHLASVARGQHDANEKKVSEVVVNIMKSFESGAMLIEPPPGQVVILDGWTMRLPGGKQVSRSGLVMQCSALKPYGWRAVPELLKWLDHREDYMRYIASRSLEDITGLHPTFYHFGQPHEPFGSDRDWFDKAKNTWSTWYEDLARKK